jgi:hypothetical protein
MWLARRRRSFHNRRNGSGAIGGSFLQGVPYSLMTFDELVAERAEMYHAFGCSTRAACEQATAEILTEHGWPSPDAARAALHEAARRQETVTVAPSLAPLETEADLVAYAVSLGWPDESAQRWAAQVETRARDPHLHREVLNTYAPLAAVESQPWAGRRVSLREVG